MLLRPISLRPKEGCRKAQGMSVAAGLQATVFGMKNMPCVWRTLAWLSRFSMQKDIANPTYLGFPVMTCGVMSTMYFQPGGNADWQRHLALLLEGI